MKRIIMLLAALSLVFATTMTPAVADEDPFFPGSINVVAGMGTGNPVYVSQNRCCGGQPTGPYTWVYAGQTSKSYWPDTDMFYVPAGRDLVYGWKASWGWVASGRYTSTGWHILSDAKYVWVVGD